MEFANGARDMVRPGDYALEDLCTEDAFGVNRAKQFENRGVEIATIQLLQAIGRGEGDVWQEEGTLREASKEAR